MAEKPSCLLLSAKTSHDLGTRDCPSVKEALKRKHVWSIRERSGPLVVDIYSQVIYSQVAFTPALTYPHDNTPDLCIAGLTALAWSRNSGPPLTLKRAQPLTSGNRAERRGTAFGTTSPIASRLALKAIAEGIDPKVITEDYRKSCERLDNPPWLYIVTISIPARLRLAAVLIPRFAPHQRAVK
jgi:hypothetical protein